MQSGGVEFGHEPRLQPPTFCHLHSLVIKTVSSFSLSMQERGCQIARRMELDEPTAAVIIQRAWRSFNVTAISILFVLKTAILSLGPGK